MNPHKEVIDNWLGKFYIEPGMPTAECVGWAKKYNLDRYGIQLGPFGGTAYKGWMNNTSFPLDKYDRIEYKPGLFPPCGATVFWNTRYNPGAGHVAIAHLGSDHDTLCTVSQNSAGRPGDAPGDEIMIKEYGYFGVVGWYVRKGDVLEQPAPLTGIMAVWQGAHSDPLFKEWYKDYTDEKPMTGRECRALNDLLIMNLRKMIKSGEIKL